MRVLQLVVLYFAAAPHSTEMLQKIVDDYKRKVATLEKSHNKVSISKNEELAKAKADLGIAVQTLAEKEAALRDLCLQHALLIRTLYRVMKFLSVTEAALQWSLVRTEDENNEEGALKTRAKLVNYIRILGQLCRNQSRHLWFHFHPAEDHKFCVNLMTKGIGPFHRDEDGRIVSLGLEYGSGMEESTGQENPDVQMDGVAWCCFVILLNNLACVPFYFIFFAFGGCMLPFGDVRIFYRPLRTGLESGTFMGF